MENNFDNFDDLVKKKLDGMDFPFNEANWAKASEMIDASRPTKKPFGGKYFLIPSVLITGVLAVSTVYYFSTRDVDANEKNVAQTVTESIVSNESTMTNNTNYSTQSASNKTSGTKNTNENNSQTSQTQETNSTNATNAIENNSALTISSPKSEFTKVTASKTDSKNTSAKNNSTAANNNSSKQYNSGINNSSKNNNSSYTPSNKKAGSNSNNNNSETNKAMNELAKGNASNLNTDNENKQEDKATENTTKAEDAIAKTDSTQAEKQTTEKTTEETTVAKVDTASNLKKDNDYVKIKHHVLNVEGGVVNSFGWKVNGIKNGNNLSPLIGINYMYNINLKTSVLVGAQYNSISNLTESHVSFSVTSYNFGANKDVTTYKLTNLQFVVVPVKFIYNIDENNSIGAGVNTSYLANIRNKIETNKNLENNAQETSTNVDNGYGYEQVNRLNAQLAISYTRKISKKIGVNVELIKTMMNVVKDYNYFGSTNNGSKPFALKFAFTYNLINK